VYCGYDWASIIRIPRIGMGMPVGICIGYIPICIGFALTALGCDMVIAYP
jgi:hypothetical protein